MFSSCDKVQDEVFGGYRAFLTTVEEMFNMDVVQTIRPVGEDFYENGVKYLNGIIDKNLVLSPYEGVLYDGRCGSWLCYVFTDNTKDSNGNWIYWDCVVAYYRFKDYKNKEPYNKQE